jgi:hypothetical protein
MPKKTVAKAFDEERLFVLACNTHYTDELLLMLHSFVVDVNAMRDDRGDRLVHVLARQGSLSPVLPSLCYLRCRPVPAADALPPAEALCC